MNTAGAIVLTIFILLIVAAVGWIFFTRWRAARLGTTHLHIHLDYKLDTQRSPPTNIPLTASPPPWNPFKSAPTYGAQPAPSGVGAWFSSQISRFRNRNNRTAAGAYEGSGTALGNTSGQRRGFGPLDPDEAWDSRVGAETDYYGPYDADENNTSGTRAGQGGLGVPGRGRGGESYNMNLAATPGQAPPGYGEDVERGRTRSRSPGGFGGSGGGAGRRNPFDDDAEPRNPFGDDAAPSLRGVSPRPIDTSVQGKGNGKDGEPGPGSAGSPSERRSVFRENV